VCFHFFENPSSRIIVVQNYLLISGSEHPEHQNLYVLVICDCMVGKFLFAMSLSGVKFVLCADEMVNMQRLDLT
jgi:hypothetical protein